MVAPAFPSSRPLRERIGALRHLPSLFRLVWEASPALTAASFGLRLARSALPILVLYIGKLIIDAVVAQTRLPPPGGGLSDWIGSGRLDAAGRAHRSWSSRSRSWPTSWGGRAPSSTASWPSATATSPASG